MGKILERGLARARASIMEKTLQIGPSPTNSKVSTVNTSFNDRSSSFDKKFRKKTFTWGGTHNSQEGARDLGERDSQRVSAKRGTYINHESSSPDFFRK